MATTRSGYLLTHSKLVELCPIEYSAFESLLTARTAMEWEPAFELFCRCFQEDENLEDGGAPLKLVDESAGDIAPPEGVGDDWDEDVWADQIQTDVDGSWDRLRQAFQAATEVGASRLLLKVVYHDQDSDGDPDDDIDGGAFLVDGARGWTKAGKALKNDLTEVGWIDNS